MCEIFGDDIVNYFNICEFYEGKPDDRCNVEEVIYEAQELWDISIDNYQFPRPSSEDIIVVTSSKPQPSFNVRWSDNNEESFSNIPAVTIPTKNKILLTRPLPSSLNSKQTLAHELGHWCFDRIFENEETDIRIYDLDYKKYSATMAFFFEDIITRNRRNCANIVSRVDMHYDGCRVLRIIEQQNQDILHNIVQEYYMKQITNMIINTLLTR